VNNKFNITTNGLLTGSVFIDLCKAFDTIDQSVLLNKLTKYGINDVELEWFNNYLLRRSQVVCLGNGNSEVKETAFIWQ
jgi:hypothetical protein